MNALGGATGRVGVAMDAVLFLRQRWGRLGEQQAVRRHRARPCRLGHQSSSQITRTPAASKTCSHRLVCQGRSTCSRTLDSQTNNLGGLAFDFGTVQFSSIKVGVNYHFQEANTVCCPKLPVTDNHTSTNLSPGFPGLFVCVLLNAVRACANGRGKRCGSMQEGLNVIGMGRAEEAGQEFHRCSEA